MATPIHSLGTVTWQNVPRKHEARAPRRHHAPGNWLGGLTTHRITPGRGVRANTTPLADTAGRQDSAGSRPPQLRRCRHNSDLVASQDGRPERSPEASLSPDTGHTDACSPLGQVLPGSRQTTRNPTSHRSTHGRAMNPLRRRLRTSVSTRPFPRLQAPRGTRTATGTGEGGAATLPQNPAPGGHSQAQLLLTVSQTRTAMRVGHNYKRRLSKSVQLF